MDNKDKIIESAEELKRGLELLSRERKVVMPHNKAFDHVDKFIEMANRFQQIEKRLTEITLSQYEKDQELEKRLRWAEFKLGNVINRLNDDESNPPDTDPAGQ